VSRPTATSSGIGTEAPLGRLTEASSMTGAGVVAVTAAGEADVGRAAVAGGLLVAAGAVVGVGLGDAEAVVVVTGGTTRGAGTGGATTGGGTTGADAVVRDGVGVAGVGLAVGVTVGFAGVAVPRTRACCAALSNASRSLGSGT
jgi:hypothetical protein